MKELQNPRILHLHPSANCFSAVMEMGRLNMSCAKLHHPQI